MQKGGKRRDIGLGSVKKVTLAQAREKAATVRSQVEAGFDPIFERKKELGIPTFRQAAALVFAENNKSWRNAKHRAQWLSTLTTYAFPHFGDMALNDIEGPHVREALVAIWLDKPETARRVRQRIVMVIDWAIAKAYREGRSDFVFPGTRQGKPLSDMTLTKICRDMDVAAVPHGFRSSFRDWVAEATEFDGDIAEMALAHGIENKVEAAFEAQLRVVLPLKHADQSLPAPEGEHISHLDGDAPALPTASDIGLGIGQGTGRAGAEETPLRNSDPKMQWLVGGTYAQFMRGLTSFLDSLPPHKQKWHRIVLTVGRRELRKGGQYGAQTYAIKLIIAALKAANEKYPDTDRGDATTTIKKLLSGQSGTKDITGHFFRCSSDHPRKTGDSVDPIG